MGVFQPKHRLGQNFLKDTRALERIAELLDIGSRDTVVEIGPGHGELTRRILKHSPKRLIAIEKDPELIRLFLKDLALKSPNLEIVEGDALDEIPKLSFEYKLVGNIPYYITSYLLRSLQEMKTKPILAIFTLQKEVARRLCTSPPNMNLLAASVKFWADVEIIRYISRKSFKPHPKVDSAIVKIVPKSPQPNKKLTAHYYLLTKTLFKQPRKTISNNLKSLSITKEMLEKSGFDPRSRPQNLSVEDIQKLTSLFTHK